MGYLIPGRVGIPVLDMARNSSAAVVVAVVALQNFGSFKICVSLLEILEICFGIINSEIR